MRGASAWRVVAPVAVVLAAVSPRPAGAQECGRAVVVVLPGVTWADVARVQPPELLEAVRAGSSGSVSVRVFSATSDYGSGFATLGAGSRLESGPVHRVRSTVAPGPGRRERVLGLQAMRRRAEGAGYDAAPGALAAALTTPVSAIGNADLGLRGETAQGFSEWVLLAAMNRDGVVPHAVTGPRLLSPDPEAPFGVKTSPQRAGEAVAAALGIECGLTVVTEGDLIRAEQLALLRGAEEARGFDDALLAADAVIGVIRSRLDPEVDTLLIVTPTAPAASGIAHLGVAIAEGPAFPPGESLASASTRRRGTVTLPDLAPTVLDHYGVESHPTMVGRPWFSVEGAQGVDAAVALDDEAVFVDAATSGVVRAFIAVQVLVYGAAAVSFARDSRAPVLRPWLERGLERAALAIVAWPLATYLMGMADGHSLGFARWALILGVLDVALVAASWVATRSSLVRLLLLNGATAALVIVDLILGARLQINTVLGYSPIVGGRFSGIGNLGFAVLAASAICTGALLVHASGGARAAIAAAGGLFALVVVVDGAPTLGSDVGGTIALVPGLGLALVLLWGRRVDVKLVLLFALGAAAVVAAFLAFDLTRPPEARTHLARLYESVAERGGEALVDAVERKAAANIRLLTRSVWALPVLPAAACLLWLVTRPQGRWTRLRSSHPAPCAGLVAAALTAALGFALNDSGIGIPSVMLAFLVPLALLVRLDEGRGERA